MPWPISFVAEKKFGEIPYQLSRIWSLVNLLSTNLRWRKVYNAHHFWFYSRLKLVGNYSCLCQCCVKFVTWPYYSCPNEVGNYRVFGPVCVCVCVSVCLSVRQPHFSAGKTGRGAILSSMVGYGQKMITIDFGVNWCIFKVAGCKEGQESDLSIWLMQKSKILMVFIDSCDTFIRCFKNIYDVFN